ncbi:RNA polymerase sigma factor [Lewinella sp. W8]|uniref:RNA polymerase sigma factor n=1 Tax=Lewinella sp. W8 TaxID=2528208 RepID=UPI0010675C7E|nr:sigma-70 family RNA polymerase sigma factor [Lewinella sp. W8]MTB50553.1 sigma-70 family RNA polymerase sigma factor [Lewinella sp. W8]
MQDLTPGIWDDIYGNYADELAAFVRARLSAEAAEDVLQEVWTALSNTLREETITQPRAWLYRVTRNRITDVLRAQARRPAFTDLTPENADPDYTDPGEAMDSDYWQEEIEEALSVLPEAQREVFVRNEMEGETLREIAEDLGVPLKTVISRKGYARKRLQDLLREVYEEYFGWSQEGFED